MDRFLDHIFYYFQKADCYGLLTFNNIKTLKRLKTIIKYVKKMCFLGEPYRPNMSQSTSIAHLLKTLKN